MNSAEAKSYTVRAGAPLSFVVAGLIAMACAVPVSGINLGGLGSALNADPEIASQVLGSPVRTMFGGSIGALGMLWTAAGSAWFGRIALASGLSRFKAAA